jgi:hypothetical protein
MVWWVRGAALAATLLLGCFGCGTATQHPTPAHLGPGTPATSPVRRDRRAAPGRAVPRPPAPDSAEDLDDDEPHASTSQVTDARAVATHFFTSYLAFLYGRLPAKRVTGAAPNLRRELQQGHATTTPAERDARPRIAHLSLTPAGPPVSVVAVAVITTACREPSDLTATLEPHAGSWLVVAVSG